ncbi:DUF6000 family protein [Kitasatospora sp. NPDC001540]|uniref:DUF6000 family protein n=1 Tax=Kitasatospora sp. NPDC001540 TaxID=3364014 RepID=UPI003694DCAB
MRSPDENDPELRELVRRYVTPDRRYLKLGAGLLRREATEREAFLRELGRDAAAITPSELAVLLEGGWRERTTAAWLIAVAGRAGFRERLGELLLASEVCYAGTAYALALAVLGTPADADLLVAYLDRYLRRPDLCYDQPAAIGALLRLDAGLGADRAARFLAPGGLWEQWIGGPPREEHHSTPDRHRGAVDELRALVGESARHCAVRER